MLFRISYSCVFLGVLGSGLALGACSSDNPNTGTGAAGTPPNTSGTTAVGGTSSGGSAAQGGSATAGTSTTVAGTTSGGMSGGTATGGTSTGGTAGGTTPGGASGSGGGGGGGGTPSKMSTGCGKDNQDDPSAWKAHDITVTVDAMFTDNAYKARRYWTRPPMGYEKNTPVPLTMWGQGCGQGGGAENVPTNQSGAAMAAVQVQFLAPQVGNKCYSAGPDGDSAKTPELPYFDAVLAETLANFCIDTSKIFMGGYSSGGWFTSLISCNRADKVRGVSWVAAGLQKNHDACVGRVPAVIVRGTEDGGTPLDQTIAARDSLIMRNGCTMETKPWLPGEATFTSSSCLEYQGCMPGYPVVYCPVPGQHTNGLDIGLSSKGFWKFWSTLP